MNSLLLKKERGKYYIREAPPLFNSPVSFNILKGVGKRY